MPGDVGPTDRVVARPEARQDVQMAEKDIVDETSCATRCGTPVTRRRVLVSGPLPHDRGRPVTTTIKKLLIANRGEIAVRVIRACREPGSRRSPSFRGRPRGAARPAGGRVASDRAPPAAESYLAIDKLVAVARRAGADAVHPGYGFLAENARFAEACAQAGLRFVGPPPAAIRTMGDKTSGAQRSRATWSVPMVPGTLEPIQSRRRGAHAGRARSATP